MLREFSCKLPLNLVLDDIQMQRYDKEKYNLLTSGLASHLPCVTQNPFHPHTTLAVNLDAETYLHTDDMDLISCIVSPWGDFIGGELVFPGLKLIISLTPFTFCDFPSHFLEHMNLEYSGKRGSLVFHTDRTSKNYHANYNDWGEFVEVSQRLRRDKHTMNVQED